ncbi:uncharacterized protein LOC109831139 [Asparagus officinalis]|uniref:uncharacterized protein LOC109831139 n=1 Tax=Asparagus officinalis TaxID=4686 RepID=UPI00098E687A|nr:uncharacterized protein LOC109831139 [Asparagus officinalis]
MLCGHAVDGTWGRREDHAKEEHLSYAGILHVIKTVILGVQIFWTSNYILPAKVLQKIDDLCRYFLWGKTDQALKSLLVAWDKVFKEKKYGGLRIFSAKTWNIVTALRTIWYIHTNKELLWIKWIHDNYLKDTSIWQVTVKKGDSWLWKQLLRVKDKMIASCGRVDVLKQIISSCHRNSKVCLSELYSKISPVTIKIPCFVNAVWNGIMGWLQFGWRAYDWNLLIDWFVYRLRCRGFKQRVKRMALASIIYRLWRERNSRFFKSKNRSVEQIIREIKVDIMTIILNGPYPADKKE